MFVGDFVSLPQFLESVLFSITCISQHVSAQYSLGLYLGGRLGSGKQNTVWFICVRVVISEVIFWCWGCTNSSFSPLLILIQLWVFVIIGY